MNILYKNCVNKLRLAVVNGKDVSNYEIEYPADHRWISIDKDGCVYSFLKCPQVIDNVWISDDESHTSYELLADIELQIENFSTLLCPTVYPQLTAIVYTGSLS